MLFVDTEVHVKCLQHIRMLKQSKHRREQQLSKNALREPKLAGQTPQRSTQGYEMQTERPSNIGTCGRTGVKIAGKAAQFEMNSAAKPTRADFTTRTHDLTSTFTPKTGNAKQLTRMAFMSAVNRSCTRFTEKFSGTALIASARVRAEKTRPKKASRTTRAKSRRLKRSRSESSYASSIVCVRAGDGENEVENRSRPRSESADSSIETERMRRKQQLRCAINRGDAETR